MSFINTRINGRGATVPFQAFPQMLETGDREARSLAAYTLGGTGVRAAIEPLARLLDESDERLRISGIESLA